MRRRMDRCGIALIVLGLWLVSTGSIAVWGVERIIAQQVDKQTILVNDPSAEVYKTFQTAGANKGVRIYYSISWLNITNPSEVLAGAKPVLVEMGPYVYRESRFKHNITFGDGDAQASFVMQTTYVWDEEANAGSGRSDTADLVTTVHPVIFVLERQLKVRQEGGTLEGGAVSSMEAPRGLSQGRRWGAG